MAHYFSYVSDFNYISLLPDAKISDYIVVKNLFRRGKVGESIFTNLVYFEKYSINGDERPDQVADKFYNNPTYDWIVFLSNNIINVQDEWPLPSYVFDKVMIQKYGSYEELYSGVHHYQSEEITNSLGEVMLKEKTRLSNTWKTNGNFIEVINSKIQSLTSSELTATVTLQNGILNLEEGTQITLSNISEREFNGQFIISQILEKTDNIVTKFTFTLNELPGNPEPVLASPRTEEVHYTVAEDSTLSGNSYYYEFFDRGLGYTVHVPKTTFLRTVTNYDYEMDQEDKKREIYLLKPDYVPLLLQDIDNIMKYKKSSQYESRTLKRGDNIRLFS